MDIDHAKECPLDYLLILYGANFFTFGLYFLYTISSKVSGDFFNHPKTIFESNQKSNLSTLNLILVCTSLHRRARVSAA